jgi:hypothetical protein
MEGRAMSWSSQFRISNRGSRTTLILVLSLGLVSTVAISGTTAPEALTRVIFDDGSSVHDVGQLRLHVSNFGLIGSMPGSGTPYGDAPSAEWPANSGVNYLYSAGLWV